MAFIPSHIFESLVPLVVSLRPLLFWVATQDGPGKSLPSPLIFSRPIFSLCPTSSSVSPPCVRLDLVNLASLSSPHILDAAPAVSSPGDGGSGRNLGFSKTCKRKAMLFFFFFLTVECVCNYASVSNGSTDAHWWFKKKKSEKKNLRLGSGADHLV